MSDQIREYKFLDISEPCGKYASSFRNTVKQNAARDHRRYERMRLTREYAKAKVTRKDDSLKQLSLKRQHNPINKDREQALNSVRRYELMASEVTESVTNHSSSDGTMSNRSYWANDICTPSGYLGAGMIDPFDTCPTEGRQYYYFLVNNCESAIFHG